MLTEQAQDTAAQEKKNMYGQYNTVDVKVHEAVGATFLGIAVLVLLVALLRAEARYRTLLVQLSSGQIETP